MLASKGKSGQENLCALKGELRKIMGSGGVILKKNKNKQ